jgi:hypothetical protein
MPTHTVWALRLRYKYYTKKYRSRAIQLCSVNPPAGLPYHSPAWLLLLCRRCAAVSVVVMSGRAPPPRGVGPILPPPRVGFVIDHTLSGCALARLPRRRFRPPILVVVSPPLRRCVPSSASFPPPRFHPPHFHPLRVRHFPSPLPHRFCPPPPHLGGAGGCVVSKGVLGAVHVVDGPYTLLLGGSSFLIIVSSLFAVVSPLICVALHLRCFGVSFGPGCRVRGISEGDRKRDSENEPRQVS